VRELENAIERACILSDTLVLEPTDLGFIADQNSENETIHDLDLSGTLSDVAHRALTLVERKKILAALKTNSGNKSRAAEDLGISYKTLLNKLKDYGL
jgi:DNA-binding NtrC family response regulator